MAVPNPRILAIQPPIYDFALFDLFLKPYGLLRVCGWLKEAGYEISFINGLDYSEPRSAALVGKPRRRSDGTGKFFRNSQPLPRVFRDRIEPPLGERRFARYGILPEILESLIEQARPDIVLIGSGMTYWYPGVLEVIEIVRRRHPGIPIVVGGVYPSLMPEHCKSVCGPDLVIKGSAWPSLPRELQRLNLPSPQTPPGLHMFPAPGVFSEAAVLKLNEGCPLRCSYCAVSQIEPGFRHGNPQDSFESVKELHTLFGVRDFAFYDDALLVGKERVLIPFLERVVASRINLRFHMPNAVHVHLINEKIAGLMKKAGFVEIRLGLESASDLFHECFDQKASRESFTEAVKILKKTGFHGRKITVYILAGLPGQRADEVEDTLRFVADQGVSVSVSEYSPLPGSALWERSIAASPFPIAEEPLFQNNSLFPVRWEGFSYQNLLYIKEVARNLKLKTS